MRSGQWIGTFSGTNSGTVVADFDDGGSDFVGVVSAYDNNGSYPRSFTRVVIPKNSKTYSAKTPLEHVDRRTGHFVTADALRNNAPNIQVPTEIEIDWDLSDETKTSVKWKTPIGTAGHAELFKKVGDKPSTLTPMTSVKTWVEFKSYAVSLPPYNFLFRGQRNSTWRLRTGFHRAGRSSLLKFAEQDVYALHRHLIGLTSHRFNLGDANDYASFLNLAQHHGYPTPLLDWTSSPFVAAYFAYRDVTRREIEAKQPVRIFAFNSNIWNQSFERAPTLMPGYLHVTFLEPLALNNSRVIPQQGLTSVTNVDDIEEYISTQESNSKKTFLTAIDLPSSARRVVMHELSLMGITAGSLFPGLDGACRQLRERYFDE